MIEVIDDFLPEKQHKVIYDRLMDSSFQWEWSGVHLPMTEVKNPLKNHQLCHLFYADQRPCSNEIGLLNPILDKLNGFLYQRIKANLNWMWDEPYEHPMHIDWPPEMLGMVKLKTAIYYVNDNNGYTIFEDGEKVLSKANRMCVFDGELRHAGVTCTDQPNRVVVNINYMTSPNSPAINSPAMYE